MSHRSLREFAKFGSGLVAADLATNIWFAYSGLLPITTFGITVTEEMLYPSIVFDVALLAFLIHYGWYIGKIPALRERSYFLLAGALFGAIAIVHFARILFSVDVAVMGWAAPHWLSWIATGATTYLAYMSFRLATRFKN